MFQQRVNRLYQFVYTDFVRPITPVRFGAKRYFFMFTDDNTHILETYTRRQKREWLKSLKVIYNLDYTCTRLDKLIKRLLSNYS